MDWLNPVIVRFVVWFVILSVAKSPESSPVSRSSPVGTASPAADVSISMVPVNYSPDIVEIKLKGNAVQTFNYFNTDKYFFYIMRNPNGYPMLVSKTLAIKELNYKSEEKVSESNKEEVELTFKWFSPAKGPPVVMA